MKPNVVLPATDRMEKAFFDLIEEKHYSKIKVSELIEKAGVSRTTFYRHYDDIFDMYKKVSERLCSFLLSEAWPMITKAKENDAVKLFDDFMINIEENHQKKLMLLGGDNGDKQFIYSLIIDMLLERIENFPSKISKEDKFKLKFVCSAGFRMYAPLIFDGKKINSKVLILSRKIITSTSNTFERYYNGIQS